MLSKRPAPSESSTPFERGRPRKAAASGDAAGDADASDQNGLNEDDLAYLARMTRWLSRDPQEAEDIAQETWLAFQRSPPRETEGKRQWLQVVARRIAARMRYRSRRVGALLEEPPDRNSLVQPTPREDIQDVVARAFRSLPEPYQEAVRLRFYEDWKPARISEELGVPVNTVNSRLQRAQQMLRRKLEPERRGSLHWLAGFLAAPFGRRESRPSIHFAPWTQGVAVVVALTCAIVYFGGDWNRREVQATQPRRIATLADRPSRAAQGFGPVRERVEARPLDAAALGSVAIVTGHVHDPQGRSLAGAEIYAWVGNWDARRVGTSAADGSFHAEIGPDDRLQGPVLGADGSIAIQARAAGWSHGSVRILPPGVTEQVSLVLSPHVANLLIAVESEDGRPLEHARITFGTESASVVGPEPDGTLFWHPISLAEPDALGTWRILGLSTGSGTLRVAAPGFAPVSVELTLQAGTHFERVVLTPGTSVSGRVVGPDGLPLENARVTRFVHHPVEDLVTYTGPDGRFSFSNLAAGPMRFAVRAADSRLGAAVTATVGSEPAELGTLVAEEQRPHRLRLLDEHDEPLGSLLVQLRNPRTEPGWVRSTLTDDDGWLQMDDAPYDELIAWAFAGKLHPEAGFPLAEFEIERGSTTVTVSERPRGISTFWSVLSTGEAPPGSFLRVRKLPTLAQRRLPLPRTGRIDLELESGPYFLTYRLPGKGEAVFGHVDVTPGSQHRFCAPALGYVELGSMLRRDAVNLSLEQRYGRKHLLYVPVWERHESPEPRFELIPGVYRLTVSDAEGRTTSREFEVHSNATTLLE